MIVEQARGNGIAVTEDLKGDISEMEETLPSPEEDQPPMRHTQLEKSYDEDIGIIGDIGALHMGPLPDDDCYPTEEEFPSEVPYEEAISEPVYEEEFPSELPYEEAIFAHLCEETYGGTSLRYT